MRKSGPLHLRQRKARHPHQDGLSDGERTYATAFTNASTGTVAASHFVHFGRIERLCLDSNYQDVLYMLVTRPSDAGNVALSTTIG